MDTAESLTLVANKDITVSSYSNDGCTNMEADYAAAAEHYVVGFPYESTNFG